MTERMTTDQFRRVTGTEGSLTFRVDTIPIAQIAAAAEITLREALNNVCRELPEHWSIEIVLAKDSGSVHLTDGDGDGHEFPSNCESVAQQLHDAVEYAKEVTLTEKDAHV